MITALPVKQLFDKVPLIETDCILVSDIDSNWLIAYDSSFTYETWLHDKLPLIETDCILVSDIDSNWLIAYDSSFTCEMAA